MEFTCPHCGSISTTSEADRRRAAHVCPSCREVFALTGLVRTTCAKPWTGLRITSEPGSLELLSRWARWNTLVPLAFLIVWLAFVASWYVFIGPLMLSFASWRSVFNLFPLLCTVAILTFTYYVFARLVDATQARLDREALVVRQRPLPLHREIRVPRADVARISVRQRSSKPPEQRDVETKGARYDVEAVLEDGRRVPLAPDLLELERALNLKHLLEVTLEETAR